MGEGDHFESLRESLMNNYVQKPVMFDPDSWFLDFSETLSIRFYEIVPDDKH